MSSLPPARRDPPPATVIELVERLDGVVEDFRSTHPEAGPDHLRTALRMLEERALPAPRTPAWTRPALLVAVGAVLSIAGPVLGLTSWAGFFTGAGGAALIAIGVAVLVAALMERD